MAMVSVAPEVQLTGKYSSAESKVARCTPQLHYQLHPCGVAQVWLQAKKSGRATFEMNVVVGEKKLRVVRLT